MKYLYKSDKYTFNDYREFCLTLTWKRKPIWIFLICVVLILILGILMKDVYLISFAICYFPVFYLLQSLQIRRTYKSNKLIQEYSALEIEFYDTYCIQKTEISETRIPYDKLYKITETKRYAYMLLGKNQGILLKKENFPEGLEEFLRTIKTG